MRTIHDADEQLGHRRDLRPDPPPARRGYRDMSPPANPDLNPAEYAAALILQAEARARGRRYARPVGRLPAWSGRLGRNPHRNAVTPTPNRAGRRELDVNRPSKHTRRSVRSRHPFWWSTTKPSKGLKKKKARGRA